MTCEFGWRMSPGGPVGLTVHLPAGHLALGAAVLAGSAGREGAISYRAVRAMAVSLAERGLVVVRFDYPGEGESFSLEPDQDVVERWVGALRSALEVARETVPGAPVDCVGVRLGASLALQAQGEIDGVKLAVDPMSGGRWLRRESAIRRFGLAEPPLPEGRELLGLHLTGEQAARVRRLADPDASSGWVCLMPSGGERDFATTEPHYAERPDGLIRAVLDAVPLESPRRVARGVVSTAIEVGDGAHAARHERVMVSDALPGVLSQPVHHRPDAALLMTSGGGEPMAGPGGLWCQVAQTAAGTGAICLRFDRRGAGELADPADRREPNPYTEAAVEDVAAAAAELSRRSGLDVTAVGLCVAGWLYARASAVSPIRRMVVFNNQAWQPRTEFYERLDARMELMFWLRETPDVDAQVEREVFTPGLWTRVRRAIKAPVMCVWTRMPTTAWRLLARAGMTQYPAQLWSVMDPSLQCEFHFGAEDSRKFEMWRGFTSLKELRGRGAQVAVHRWAHLDHGLLSAAARDVVRAVILDDVMNRYRGAPDKAAGPAQ